MVAEERAREAASALGRWSSSDRPLYLALADALAAAVRTGRLAPHLPSERAFALALNVSRGTVANAYEILRERGVLEREQGSGSVALGPRAHEICTDPLSCIQGFFAEREKRSSGSRKT